MKIAKVGRCEAAGVVGDAVEGVGAGAAVAL